ncbi:hypothetical protein MTR67_013193, partial [Solanum verrucosum]
IPLTCSYIPRTKPFTLHLLMRQIQSSACSQPDEGSPGDQQWFLSAGHIQGVDSGRDKIPIFFGVRNLSNI